MFAKMLKHRMISAIFFASLIVAAGGYCWAWLALRNVGAAGPLILHFNDLEGITAVGSSGVLHFAGIFGIAAVLVNYALALELEERDPVLGKVAAGATFAFAVLLFAAFVAIIGVN